MTGAEKAKLAQLDSGDKSTVVIGISGTHDNRGVDFLASQTNAATALNSAINSLPASGRSIMLLDGTYTFTETVVLLKSNVKIYGMGNGTYLRTVQALTNGIFRLVGVNNLFADLRFNSGTATAMTVLGSNNKVRDVTFQFCASGLEGLSGSNLLTVESCSFLNNTSGIAQKGNGGLFLGNTFQSCATGMRFEESNNVFVGNLMADNDVGIRFVSGSRNVAQNNVVTRGTGRASDYTSSQYTVRIEDGVTKSLIAGNVLAGKDISDASSGSTNIKEMNIT